MSRPLHIALLVLPLVALSVQAQDQGAWNGRRCAVALTYDDALNTHLDHVIPLLDTLGFKGTFYLSGFFPGLRERVKDWIAAAREGHELGNHTLFHPCEGKAPGREWVSPEYDLNVYTVRRIVDEIRMANVLLETMDGMTARTFAYPCGDTKAGDSSYVDAVRGLCVGARGVEGKLQTIDSGDLYGIGAYMINGQSGDERIRLVKEAEAKGALCVFLFHGVGGEHSLNVSLDAHRMLLMYLKGHEQGIWVAPMRDLCALIKAKRR
jgi:peptidoglycan/xylan/chitin deacetylase (PgdA/CDA1 family)